MMVMKICNSILDCQAVVLAGIHFIQTKYETPRNMRRRLLKSLHVANGLVNILECIHHANNI